MLTKPVTPTFKTLTMSNHFQDKLSEEDQELLDQALANLCQFVEEETSLGLWEEEVSRLDEENSIHQETDPQT